MMLAIIQKMENTFNEHGSYLCHFGRKGMKWGEHIYAKEAARIDKATTKYNNRLHNVSYKSSSRAYDDSDDGVRAGLISRAISRNDQDAKRAKMAINNAVSGGKESWKEYKRENKNSYGLTKFRQRRETAKEFNSFVGRKNRRYENGYQRSLRYVIRTIKNEKLTDMAKRKGSTDYSLDKYMSKLASVRQQTVSGAKVGGSWGGSLGGLGGGWLGYEIGRAKAFGPSNQGTSYDPTNTMYTKDLPAYLASKRR